MTQHYARQGLHFDVLQRSSLDLRKMLNLALRKGNVIALLSSERSKALCNLRLAESIVLAIPPVEADA